MYVCENNQGMKFISEDSVTVITPQNYWETEVVGDSMKFSHQQNPQRCKSTLGFRSKHLVNSIAHIMQQKTTFFETLDMKLIDRENQLQPIEHSDAELEFLSRYTTSSTKLQAKKSFGLNPVTFTDKTNTIQSHYTIWLLPKGSTSVRNTLITRLSSKFQALEIKIF